MSFVFLLACIALQVKGNELPCPKGYTSKNGLTPGCKYDPCLSINHKEIDQWERSVANKKLYNDGYFCDSFLKRGWYRPTSKAGNAMPTKCLYTGCGTIRPIWMKGNLPKTGEIVDVKACVSNYTQCCARSYEIQVKNCSSFNIYNLVPTYGCAQAYCFGSELPCPTGYSSDTGFTPGCARTTPTPIQSKGTTSTPPRPKGTSTLLPLSLGLAVNGRTRTIQAIPMPTGNRLAGQAKPLVVEPVSPGSQVNEQRRPLPVEYVSPGSQANEQRRSSVVPLSSELGDKQYANNNDGTWMYIVGVVFLMQMIVLVVYLVTKHMLKKKKYEKTAPIASDDHIYEKVYV